MVVVFLNSYCLRSYSSSSPGSLFGGAAFFWEGALQQAVKLAPIGRGPHQADNREYVAL